MRVICVCLIFVCIVCLLLGLLAVCLRLTLYINACVLLDVCMCLNWLCNVCVWLIWIGVFYVIVLSYCVCVLVVLVWLYGVCDSVLVWVVDTDDCYWLCWRIFVLTYIRLISLCMCVY